MVIGRILEDGTVEKGATDQGFVFKDDEAFENKTGVCYVPELSDVKYTYDDILKICKGSKGVAAAVFDIIDWQNPGSVYSELIEFGEIHECKQCNVPFLSYKIECCPNCGTKKGEC